MVHILIDGYNLIRSSASLTKMESASLEKGRLALIYRLAEYKKMKGHTITVVFDAALTDNLSVEEDRKAGIRILYSEMGQKADEVIIKLARQLKDKTVVVSSDREIQQAARLAGAGVMESQEFEKKLNEALIYGEAPLPSRDEEHQPLHKRWITMKKGPAKRLPKAKRRALSKLRDL